MPVRLPVVNSRDTFITKMFFTMVFLILVGVEQCSSRMILPRMSRDDLKYLESSISNTSCEFYSNLENVTRCGSNGYVDKFILKYCLAYLNQQDKFIDQSWMSAVRVCLQQLMLNHLRTDLDPSCSQIKQWGFDSHTSCYLHPDPDQSNISFCNLPKEDIFKVIWIAKGAAFEPAVWFQLLQIIESCTT